MRQPQREKGFPTRLDRNPFVRIRSGERHAGFNLDEFPRRRCTPHLAKCPGIVRRGTPRLQKISPQANEKAGLGQIMGWNRSLLKADSIRLSQRLETKRLIGHQAI